MQSRSCLKECVALLLFVMFAGCNELDALDIKGKIFVKGSMPQTYIAIEDLKTKKVYKIKNAKYFHLDTKQKKLVYIKAKLIEKEIAPGWPAVIEVVEVLNSTTMH